MLKGVLPTVASIYISRGMLIVSLFCAAYLVEQDDVDEGQHIHRNCGCVPVLLNTAVPLHTQDLKPWILPGCRAHPSKTLTADLLRPLPGSRNISSYFRKVKDLKDTKCIFCTTPLGLHAPAL